MFYGPPGTGKTALAGALARALDLPVHVEGYTPPGDPRMNVIFRVRRERPGDPNEGNPVKWTGETKSVSNLLDFRARDSLS